MITRFRSVLTSRIPASTSLAWFFSSAPSTKMSSVKELVESTIEKNPIVIFSKSYCPYCRRAKQLLKDKFSDVEQTVLELDERSDGDEIQAYLHTKTGQRTVPNIFISCDDTTAAVANGKIAGLLKASQSLNSNL
ncbi:hypothetical protein NMY22_g10891 [Coprinellus aureogranulatus]|nr:hypothetical protein NMY22_g10891 [Coprinellus aureogranulatus]